MQRRTIPLTWLGMLAGLASCVGLSVPPSIESPRSSAEWMPGEAILQGFFGVQRLETFDRSGGVEPSIEQERRSQYPVIGGGAQWKLAGEGLDLGLEGLLAFGWRTRGGAVASGPGGLEVAVDVNLFSFDLFGGPFASVFLFERLRLFAAAGPLMQFVEFDQKAVPAGALGEDFDRSGSGFGLGLYARTGVELLVTPYSWLGLGVRWTDSLVDLGRGMGELDLEGIELVLTLSNF